MAEMTYPISKQFLSSSLIYQDHHGFKKQRVFLKSFSANYFICVAFQLPDLLLKVDTFAFRVIIALLAIIQLQTAQLFRDFWFIHMKNL